MTNKLIKVGYDAGHGYNTAGKRTPDGEREWTFNDTVARAFANQLALYSGVASKRFDDPTGKTDVSLYDRTNGANNWGATHYISFHHNAYLSKWGTHTGVETHIYLNPGTVATKMAEAIQPALVKAYGLRDRGIKKTDLHITRETYMPAILIEGGFMDSTIDIKKLRDKAVLQKAGRDIADAFAKFAGLKKTVVKEKEKTTTTPATNTTALKKGDKYEVVKSINGYMNAANAKAKKSNVKTVKPGSYYIFNISDGMLNVSTKKGTAGSWINPADNKKSTAVKHTVKSGDTLSTLAKKYSTTVAAIQSLNSMGQSTLIKVGQVLVIKN